jgi:polyphosphate kinase
VGYKIHAKSCLVVRREGHELRRYVHLSTGNYNPTTARMYTDLGLLTCRPEFGEDITNFFNLLTGICQFQPMKKLILAPFELHGQLLKLIEREADNARRGLPARIIARINSLADPQLIQALYRASQAGVKIDLIVRGICSLRPGVPGVSENITVRSIIDRFLEHCRIYYFENACQPDVYLASADWLPRNMFRRIEMAYPVVDGNLRERIVRDLLGTTMADNMRARFLRSDGTYAKARRAIGIRPRRSQFEFIEMARQAPERASGGASKRRITVKLAKSPFKKRTRT